MSCDCGSLCHMLLPVKPKYLGRCWSHIILTRLHLCFSAQNHIVYTFWLSSPVHHRCQQVSARLLSNRSCVSCSPAPPVCNQKPKCGATSLSNPMPPQWQWMVWYRKLTKLCVYEIRKCDSYRRHSCQKKLCAAQSEKCIQPGSVGLDMHVPLSNRGSS